MSSRHELASQNETVEPFQFEKALEGIARDTVRRSGLVVRRLWSHLPFLFIRINGVTASPINPQTSDDPVTSAGNVTYNATEAAYLTSLFQWKSWNRRADDIRHHVSRTQCMVNLNALLSTIGPLEMASTNGSSGALTLLPTAGALIGAPTKELWVVYKLMPVAGVLSMLLSLGGNIVPTEASDYEMKAPRFSYGGLIATRCKEEDTEEPEEGPKAGEPESQVFADMVERGAKDPRGGQRFARVWCVAVSSMVENCAGVPFTHQWTLRVSRAPRVRISEDAPIVRLPQAAPVFRPVEDDLSNTGPSRLKGDSTVQVFEEVPLVHRTVSGRSTEILDALEAGFNCKGQVIRDGNQPWSSSRVPFYVIISLEGISGSHATLRVFSKAFAIGVFVRGTVIFASTQLIEMSVAVAALCLVLGAGVFGRVIALWMASEMMKTNPVLHRVLKSRGLAAEYIDRILSIDGLVVEIMGHVIVNGRCIKRYNPWFKLSNWFGLLAGPFDIWPLTVVN